MSLKAAMSWTRTASVAGREHMVKDPVLLESRRRCRRYVALRTRRSGRPPLSSSPVAVPAYPVLQRVIPLVLQPLGPPALDGTVIAAHRPCDGRCALSLQHQLHHLLPLPPSLVHGPSGTACSVAAAKVAIQAIFLHFRSKSCLCIQMFCI